ncbi:MAG: FtsQ-type POTRA domain-containing protein [Actinomycetota bacterium]
MSDKVERTRGARVRASRAKSRVEARKKSRAASRAPGRTGRGGGRKSAEKAVAVEAPAGQETAPRSKSERRREVPPARTHDRARKNPTATSPETGRGKRREKKSRHREPASAAGMTAVAPGTGAEEAVAVRPQATGMLDRPRGHGGSAARTAFLGAVLVASLAALLWVYTGTGVLNIKVVEFEGNGKLQPDYLRALSGINGDTHLLKMDVGAVESALLSEPYIARADITRHFPNSVKIKIVERRPSGYVLQNGRYALIDQEGMVLESVEAVPPGLVEIRDLTLPLLLPGHELSGIEFASVTSLIGSLPQALRDRTAAVGIGGGGGMYIVADGTTVIYGDAEDFARKNTIALMALSVLVQRYGAIEYLDVSYPEHPVIKPLGNT